MPKFEEFKTTGAEVVDQVKRIIHEGNVRSIAIKQSNGRTIVQFPLTIGVVGAALAPVLAAVGAIAALVTDCTIVVERTDDAPPSTIDVDPVSSDSDEDDTQR